MCLCRCVCASTAALVLFSRPGKGLMSFIKGAALNAAHVLRTLNSKLCRSSADVRKGLWLKGILFDLLCFRIKQ